jgi:hypothetical protein
LRKNNSYYFSYLFINDGTVVALDIETRRYENVLVFAPLEW